MQGDGGGGAFMSGDGGGGGFMSGDGGGNMGNMMNPARGGGTVDGGTYTEGFAQREAKSIGGAFCSFCCVIPIIILLVYFNELNLVKSDATAELVQKARVVHGCSPADEDNGHLVYTSCQVQCPDIAQELPSPLSPFYSSFYGTELKWEVEIYQYEESSEDHCTKNNDGSKTCHTTYSYSAGWHSSSINSNSFHSSYYSNADRYGVMTSLPGNFDSGSADAPDHSVMMLDEGGSVAYSLPNKLAQMFPSKDISPQSAHSRTKSWQGSGNLHSSMLESDGYRLVTYSGSPSIGDLRITLTGKTGTKASVAAKQVSSAIAPGFTFKDYPPKPFDFFGRETYPLARLEDHIESKKKFIKEWHDENNSTAMIFRIILLIAMIMACRCLLQPLSVMADLLRIINCFTCGLGTLLDNAAQGVICMVSCGLGCCVFLFVLALSWFLVRPTLSVGMIALGLVFFIGLHLLKAQQGKSAKAREAEGYINMNFAPHVVMKGCKVQPTVQVV